MKIKMDKSVNEKLLKVYEEWEEHVLKQYIDKFTNSGEYKTSPKAYKWEKAYEGTQLSCPFYMGLTDDYINNVDNKKRVMIVGQEARKYGIYTRDKNKEEYRPTGSQKWAKCYLCRQISPKDSCCELKYNASRFWDLFRALKNDYVLCWTDIDKVYYNRDGDYKGTLTRAGEAELNKRYDDKQKEKSILEREIELAKPDYIVFVIGPSYYVSLEKSFGLKENALKGELRVGDGLIPISKQLNIDIPAFWTYHPANRSGVNVISLVKDALSKINEDE